MMPETKKRTLEELDRIFEARNPVKESLKPVRLAVDQENNVLAAEETEAKHPHKSLFRK